MLVTKCHKDSYGINMKKLGLLGMLMVVTSCDARGSYLMGEGILFIGLIFALILGVGFIYGGITQDINASSESKKTSTEFGWWGVALVASAILALLYKCS